MSSLPPARWWSIDECGWVDGPPRRGLLAGVNHVALLTADIDRLQAFYREVFDAAVFADLVHDGMRVSLIDVGPATRLNVFQLPDRRDPPPVDRPCGHRRLRDRLRHRPVGVLHRSRRARV